MIDIVAEVIWGHLNGMYNIPEGVVPCCDARGLLDFFFSDDVLAKYGLRRL